MKRIPCILLAALLFTSGCIKKGDLNLKNIKLDNWTPDWALPLLNSKLTLKDMIKTGSVVTEDAAGLYSLHYDGKLFSARAGDYIHIPDQHYVTPPFTLTVPVTVGSFTGTVSDSFKSNFSYTDTSGAQLAHIAVRSGTIHLNASSTYNQNVTLNIVFPKVTSGGTPLQVTANIIYPSNSVSVNADLGGYVIDMTNGAGLTDYTPYKIYYTLTGTGQPLSSSGTLSANIDMANIQYSFLDGILGHYSIPIPADTIDINIFDNTIHANIYLRNPKVHLAFTNSFGVGIATQFDELYGLTNNGTRVDMSLGAINVNGATTPGQTVTTNVTEDSTNSSVQTLFNPAPNKVIYNGHVLINPGSSAYTFVYDTSTVTLFGNAELPAWFNIIDFSLQDTVKLLLPQDTSILQHAEFKMLVDNAFPLYGSIQFYFVDSNNMVMDSLITPNSEIIGQAPVDASGIVNGHTSQVTHFVMDHDKYNNMASRCRSAYIRANLKTSGTNSVQIHSTDNISVKLAFRFTLNVSSQNL